VFERAKTFHASDSADTVIGWGLPIYIIINVLQYLHVASSTNGGGVHIGYWWECQKERVHWEDQDVCGWTILKWIFERYDGMVWTELI
jgi:hypothetical protein